VKAHAASNFALGAPPYATSTAFSNTQGGWVARVGLEWMITSKDGFVQSYNAQIAKGRCPATAISRRD
jgi:hypothetical protein